MTDLFYINKTIQMIQYLRKTFSEVDIWHFMISNKTNSFIESFKSSQMVRDVRGRKELYSEGTSCLAAGLGGSDGKYRIGGWAPKTKYKSSDRDH